MRSIYHRVVLAVIALAGIGQTSPASITGESGTQAVALWPAGNSRYGPFGLMDGRRRYGQFWFPEPFRVDETDVDNELRIDWVHQEGRGNIADDAKAEIEKSFGLLTLELELPYSRNTSRIFDPTSGKFGHDRSEGIGNISIGARHPIYEFVSSNEFLDNTVVVGFEVGIPTHSPVSKNTELVPKLIDDLRLGEHFSVQTVLGYSFLFGSAPDGGKHTFEYAAVLGYSFERNDVRFPGTERIIPILELKGETGLNKEDAGHNNLSGTLGVRFNLESIGQLQPRLGLGYVFPIDKRARDEFRWGIVTSLVFEF
ncbi:MAG TPA: hypothetical protein VIM11_16330 [Tepidisphaeraceae bacterium]